MVCIPRRGKPLGGRSLWRALLDENQEGLRGDVWMPRKDRDHIGLFNKGPFQAKENFWLLWIALFVIFIFIF